MAYRFKHGDRPLDDFTVQRAVGSGGFGEVYYAISDGGREVALKYLRQNPEVELRGVSHCINLKSPHLVSIFDVKKNADGEYFIIMEYCSGPSLRDLLIAEPNGFEPQKAAFFLREIAKGLSYLHDRGIVHRDLKPGNIFYDDGYVKIGDYGLSKFIAVSRHSVQTSSVGTVHYMAPEIGSGDYSRSVDIYALGVMLYEMLLGKVPFEGSSMAEILMKHLTTQPEVDELPDPFGRVIRKALEKDPKDRYQSVDEMVDDLMAQEDVQKSLAGFSPQSLEGAVRQGAGDHADSPIPSPNPIPGYVRDYAQGPAGRGGALPAVPVGPVGSGPPFTARLTKRMDRISRKFDQRMAKLVKRGGVRPGRFERGVPATATPQAGGHRRRMWPALMLSVGLLVGLGVLFGSTWGEPVTPAAFMLALAMAGSIGLSRKTARWFDVTTGPKWAGSVVRLCVSAPLLFMGAAPLLDGARYNAVGLAVVFALLAVAWWADWDTVFDRAVHGELDVWGAIWKGVGAGLAAVILAGMFDAGREELAMYLAASVCTAATLIVQANAWWMAGRGKRGQPGSPAAVDVRGASEQTDGRDDAHRSDAPPYAQPVDLAQFGSEQNDEAAKTSAAGADTVHRAVARRQRLWVSRAFWSIASFVFMGGAIVGFLVPLIAQNVEYHDVTAAIIGCIGSASLMIFALRKTTMYKRDGFWRETLRPLMISVLLFGVGATITGIAREWDYHTPYEQTMATVLGDSTATISTTISTMTWRGHVGDVGRIALVVGLVLCSLLLIGITLFTGHRRRVPKPFLQEPNSE
ncbi:MAG: serine/threonine protein kinase [Planctomycetes bacterium]|nr:serine/threonine protein kinase [Planctomycetota bacterium]